MKIADFGIIGLGVMGRNLALNILDKGHTLSVYNRPEESELVEVFLKEVKTLAQVQTFTEIAPFVASLAASRKILIMIKAGEAVDQIIASLQPHLSKEDTLIDGGNSHYADTQKRFEALRSKGIHFVGCGISGGQEGALRGPSLMPGGSIKGYDKVAPILTSIAAKDKHGNPCCTYISTGGAGHFVKMVHNGIEYAEMQLLAEVYHLLKPSYTHKEIAGLFSMWQTTDLASYLLEITLDVLKKKEGTHYLLDLVLDKAANKGTGAWSSQASLALGVPATLITEAVFARYISSLKSLRTDLHFRGAAKHSISPKKLEKAYRFARWINHIQGIMLIEKAADHHDWDINLSALAGVWTQGCIIRSSLMERLAEELKKGKLITQPAVKEEITALEKSVKKILIEGIEMETPTPALSSAYQFWLSITSQYLPANLVQAQRDYFGAHTYQRVDKPETDFFHTNWAEV